MFDPFFTTKGVGEGTGLGLSLVHGIVADLGGAIDVRTTVGRGTTFTIWLPIAGEATAPSVEVATELPRGHGQTVMIVDDEKPLVALAEEIAGRARLRAHRVQFQRGGAGGIPRGAAALRYRPDR